MYLLIFLVFAGCGNSNPTSQNVDETPTRGNIKIAVDESYQLLIDSEVYVFQSLYKYASIKPFYKPEIDAVNMFLQDSVRTIITSRQLTQEQIDYLKGISIYPRTTKIAYDALAFIVNRENADSLIRFYKIQEIFTGKAGTWKNVNPKSKLDKIKVVFDNMKSSNVRYFLERFNLKKLPEYCYAVDNNEAVIDFVQKNKNALGIISLNWISDKQDSVSRKILSKIQVCAISPEANPDGDYFYKASQGFIVERSYPFVRDVFVICRETFAGLGSGFASFVAGDQGQRIVLKSGLVPATMPIRLIQQKRENIQ